MAVMFSWKAAGSNSIPQGRHFNRRGRDFSKFISTRPHSSALGRSSCTRLLLQAKVVARLVDTKWDGVFFKSLSASRDLRSYGGAWQMLSEADRLEIKLP
jgi:hypothetical protein